MINEAIVDRAAKLRDRPIHIFKIPTALHKHGVLEIGLVEISMEEELLATKRARGDAVRLAYEYSKECLRLIDGKPVRTHDGSADRAWADLHPKIRQLVMQGYGMLHQPQGDEGDGFLESHEVRVG